METFRKKIFPPLEFSSILFLLFFVFTSIRHGEASGTPSGINFLAIGDWGRDGHDHQSDVAAQFIDNEGNMLYSTQVAR